MHIILGLGLIGIVGKPLMLARWPQPGGSKVSLLNDQPLPIPVKDTPGRLQICPSAPPRR